MNYTPDYPEAWPSENELTRRWSRLQELMSSADLDGALFYQNADLIYLCGSTQFQAFFLPKEGNPLLLIRPPLARAAAETPWAGKLGAGPKAMPPGDELEAVLKTHVGGKLSRLGLEMDVLPVNDFNRLAAKYLANLELADVAPLIRQVRSVKSVFEVGLIRKAAEIIDESYQAAPGIISQGVTELELEARMMSMARIKGHQGLVRMRGFNTEFYFGHVLSGLSGLLPSKLDSPTGGRGVGPGLGNGAGPRAIGPDELVSVDVCGGYGGYISDQTRLYFTGRSPEHLTRTYEALLELVDVLLSEMKPDVVCGDIYDRSFQLAEELGLAEGYMGRGDDRCPFIGHGLGLELNEWPVLARGSKMRFSPGMVFALEPRVFLPDLGVVGLEDTYLMTETGPELLTITDRGIKEVELL